MKRIAGLASGLFLLASAAGCCHHMGGCMPGGAGACPPAYGGYGVTPGAMPVYPQTGAIYSPVETVQSNYGGAPVALQPVALQPVVYQSAMLPLESLPTY